MFDNSAPIFARQLCLSALLIAFSAHAQYQWRDSGGSMVYSDRPPPPGAAVKIIKSPATVTPVPVAPASTGSASAAAPASASAPARQLALAAPTGAASSSKSAADRALADKVRMAAEGEKAKELAKNEQLAKDQARQCESLRENLRLLDSGERISKLGKSGEREFMSDAERAARAAEGRKDLAAHCK